jgi:ABC-type uncharacterized transport system involved in gliding motility auxiliary subunit
MTGWPALLGALGLVFVVFGLLSVLLLAAGAPTDWGWIVGNFAIGVALLGVSLAAGLDTLRERLASGEARRVGKFGTSAIGQTLLAVAILAMFAFLANRHHTRFDWSEAGVHSLSDQTRKVLDSLERDVEVVAFYPPLDAQPVRELLDRYAYASQRFRVQFADPNARPDLVERFGVSPEKLQNGLVRVALGEESIEVSEPDEEKLTNALVKLTRTEVKKVYFLAGHNERPVEGEGADQKEGFARAADALRNENYTWEKLLLATQADVPADAHVVVIAGATRPLLPVEHEALERYLERGGALLVMLDPRANTDLAEDLVKWGVEPGEDVVVDRVQGMFGQAMTPFAGSYGDHPITSGLREVTLFHVARSVTPRDDARDRFSEIVMTSEHSWGERDLGALFGRGVAELGADDRNGPVPVAVAGTPRVAGADAPSPEVGAEGEAASPPGSAERKPRLVVVGDSDFASNQLIEAYRNRDLFVNAVNWLLGDVEAIAIRPARSRASRLELSTQQFSQIRYLSLFVLPEAIAVCGVVAWWSRRRAPGR